MEATPKAIESTLSRARIQTDPNSGRIVFWEDRHANGMQVMVKLDYPNDGPRDIFEMGAPSTAEVIKIATPESNLFGK